MHLYQIPPSNWWNFLFYNVKISFSVIDFDDINYLVKPEGIVI